MPGLDPASIPLTLDRVERSTATTAGSGPAMTSKKGCEGTDRHMLIEAWTWRKPLAGAGRWPASRSGWGAGTVAAFLGPTEPASRPPCACSPAISHRMRDRPASPASTSCAPCWLGDFPRGSAGGVLEQAGTQRRCCQLQADKRRRRTIPSAKRHVRAIE
jgi:hypothetical protein